MCFVQPSYNPSIPPTSFELCKNVYHIPSSAIPFITTYLKPSDQSNELLEVFINIGNQITLSKEEYNTILVENASEISEFFFRSDDYSPQRQQQVITYINLSEHEKTRNKLVIIHFKLKSMCIYAEEWWCLKHFMNCLDSRLCHLQKVKGYYENRMNFFRKRFKFSQVKTLHDAFMIVNNIYDKMSIVDNEIRCYVIEYLFYSSLL